MNHLRTSSRAFQETLAASGLDLEVVELPSSTRTAAQAAEAIGCTVAQIAKSLIFQGAETGKGLLVVASGPNRVDTKLVAEIFGEAVEMASPAFVREATGFAIGGVPPCGHRRRLETVLDRDFFDRDLLDLKEIWAAAGTPNAVFRLTPDQLRRLTSGTIARIC